MSYYDDDNWTNLGGSFDSQTRRANLKAGAIALAVGILAGVVTMSVWIELGAFQ